MNTLVQRTTDVNELDRVVRAPEVWALVRDDASPRPEEVTMAKLAADPRNVFLAVLHRGEPAGWIGFFPDGEYATYEMHTNLLNNCRGAAALEAGWAAVDWLFRNTPAKQIRTYVFDTARAARLMLQAAHWNRTGSTEHAATVDGRPVREIWYHYTRAEWVRR